ncbi:helix-turn-helix domain-containing protein [Kitasatospora sp. NPDC088779]|uniref:helix-turn-helix domain-containing protein n=1 Tax=unclassified Kitasatospora TaxID=2633591 RepID=UPI00343BD944
MPTIGFATSVPQAELSFVDESAGADADRPLHGVLVLPQDTETPAELIRHHLVVVQAADPRLSEPARLAPFLTHLARSQATGLAVAHPPGAQVAAHLRAPANRHGLPLLGISDDPAAWFLLHRAVLEQHHSTLTRSAALHRELLEQTHHLGRPDGTQRLVAWLASFTCAHVTVTFPQGLTVTSPDNAVEVVRPADRKIAELARGGIRSAALDIAGRQIRLFTIGEASPAPVLAVAAPAFSPETSTAIARTLDLLALQSAVEDAARGRERLRRGEESVREAVLQLLMTGHVTDAQRCAVGLSPGVLDTEECRVFVLKAPHADRKTVIRQCQEAVDGSALVSGCPAFPDEVIVVVPHCGVESEVVQGLTAVTEDAPHRYLGGSSTHRLAETAQAYVDASRALAVARRIPGRIHLYVTEVQLAHVLDSRADAWAQAHLAPLLGLPEDRREQILATLRLGLVFTPAAAARIIGTHRNTVARRLGEAATLLQSDFQDLVQRAVLGLALEVRARGGHRAQTDTESVGIRQLLDSDQVRQWAENFLEPLEDDRRPLSKTLITWIGANTRVDDTASALSMNPATVRSHLRRTERLLQRRLVTGTSYDVEDEANISGSHDVVLALAVLCDAILQI